MNEVEIIDIIKQLDINKSSDFSPKVLKHINHIISPVLKGLFNNCLRLCIFPNELKIAKVTPLFKLGNINDMSNYRPISILPVLSKILEKIIYKRLADFFTVNNVLNEAQFGFRQSHSTIQAVQTAVNSIVNTMNTSSYCMGIFIDFSKAFDTIRHDISLHKLKHYGIRGLAYDLISDYLSNRKQFVIYDAKTCSDLLPVSIGVPQGSVLGPLFLIIYVNDLFNCGTDSVRFIMFADDTNIFISASSTDELYSKANNVLMLLKNYIDANYLHINLKKSKYMQFRSARGRIANNIVYYDKFPLKRVSTIKFLGVIISEKLTWNAHIKYLTNKLSKITGSLFKLRNIIPSKMLRNIYYALVNSQINYGITLWGSMGSTSRLSSLFSAQKKCIRKLYRVKRISKNIPGHTKATFNNNSILTVHNLYYVNILTETFKYIYSDCVPLPIRKCIRPYLSQRSNILFILPKLRLSEHQNNFPYSNYKIWNLFINISFSLDDISVPVFPYWKVEKFRRSICTSLLRIQSLPVSNLQHAWHEENLNLFTLQSSLMNGNLNLHGN